MDGLALLTEIRTRRPDTPIHDHRAGEHTLAIQALRGGAYDFIHKPIDRIRSSGRCTARWPTTR